MKDVVVDSVAYRSGSVSFGEESKGKGKTLLLDDFLAKIREQILGVFGPPGTSEVDSVMRHVKFQMANYALAAVADSEVRKEVEAICEEMALTGW